MSAVNRVMLIVAVMLVMGRGTRFQRLEDGAVLRRARPAAADIGELSQVVAKAGQFDDLLLHLASLVSATAFTS